MHQYSVFTNSCLKVPVDPLNKMPKTAYERGENVLVEQLSIDSSTTTSMSGDDIDSKKLKDFYQSIPDYNDINHLPASEFYSTLKCLREKKKVMLRLTKDQIIDRSCTELDLNDFHVSEQDNKYKSDKIPNDKRKSSLGEFCGIDLNKNRKPMFSESMTKESPKNNLLDRKNSYKVKVKSGEDQSPKTKKQSSLTVTGTSKGRPKRNHSACSISWHDDKIEIKNEIDEKFDKFFDRTCDSNMTHDNGNEYKTQSMPTSPLRSRRVGNARSKYKTVTIPKPFKMTERDEDERIVNELRTIQKSFSDDMLNQKLLRKQFKAKPVPIESRIPLYDKILEDQAMSVVTQMSHNQHAHQAVTKFALNKSLENEFANQSLYTNNKSLYLWRAVTKINSEAELRARMKPFSFTKREENCNNAVCERAGQVLPKSKKKKRFKARPVPKNLFSNYFYDKMKEDSFFRSMNRRIRAEEMLRNASMPGAMGSRERSRLSTPAAHSDLPIDPSLAASVSSTDFRSNSPTKGRRKSSKAYKDNFITTSPQPFRFNTADRADKKLKEIQRKVYQGSNCSESNDNNQRVCEPTKAYSALDLNSIAVGRSNLAALLRAEAVRRKFEMDAAKHLAEQRRRLETKFRDRQLRSKPAWHLVKNNHEEDIAMRLQTRRDEEKLRREEFLHEMELMYGRVQRQPMLFERYYAPRPPNTEIEFSELSPRKSPKKKSLRKKKIYHLSSRSSDFQDDAIKYLGKMEKSDKLYEDSDVIDSLE